MSQAQNNFFLWGAWRGKGRLAARNTSSCCFAVGLDICWNHSDFWRFANSDHGSIYMLNFDT